MDASAYCENLVLDEKTDWRLPFIDELKRLLDYGQYKPATDTTIFPGMGFSGYWSGSNHFTPSGAWYVDLYHGEVKAGYKTIASSVRCVRRGLDHLIL